MKVCEVKNLNNSLLGQYFESLIVIQWIFRVLFNGKILELNSMLRVGCMCNATKVQVFCNSHSAIAFWFFENNIKLFSF
jgi:hypothetical protein